jgi:Tfp pilus assembly protein FimT
MTLLETCTGVVIISGVVIFAAPSLIRARENYQLDVVSRQVAGKMQWTRIKAISRSRDCRIRVTSDVAYAIECEDSTWRTDEIVVLPRGFRISANASPQFHKRGNASPAGTFTISDSRLKSRRVIVNITGRVRVE